MIVTLLIWFPQTILCFTNYKTKRKPYHRSKLDSQSNNSFATLNSDFFLGKRRRSLEFLLKTLTIHKGSWTTTRRCSARRSTNFARSPEKVGFGITIRCQLFPAQTSLLSQKMLIRFGKKHFDFLEECVMLPKQKMELALKISQNPKKFWIIKPPGWSFICGVDMLKVFNAEAPIMQILQSVTQSYSYSLL